MVYISVHDDDDDESIHPSFLSLAGSLTSVASANIGSGLRAERIELNQSYREVEDDGAYMIRLRGLLQERACLALPSLSLFLQTSTHKPRYVIGELYLGLFFP